MPACQFNHKGCGQLQEANARNTGPLLEHEIKIIGEQLRFMGKQPRRWELIVNQHMPYRTVTNVSKMWAAFQASLQGRTPGEHGPTRDGTVLHHGMRVFIMPCRTYCQSAR